MQYYIKYYLLKKKYKSTKAIAFIKSVMIKKSEVTAEAIT